MPLIQYPRIAAPPPGAPRIEPTWFAAWQPGLRPDYINRPKHVEAFPYFFYGFPTSTFPAPAPLLAFQLPQLPARRKEYRHALPYLFWYPFTPVPTAYGSTPLALIGRSGSTINKSGRSQSALPLNGEAGSVIEKTGKI